MLPAARRVGARRGERSVSVTRVANLLCDVDHARGDAAERRARGEPAPSPRDPRFAARPAVRRRAAALGTLFGRLGEEGDAVELELPVDPARLPAVRGLVSPRIAVAVPSGAAPGAALRWGRIDATGRHANDRTAWLDALGHEDALLPGTLLVRNVDELARHLDQGGAVASPGLRWSLAAPFGASGRGRVFGRGAALDDAARAAARRVLDLHGRAVFTPWMRRVLDLGTAAAVPLGPVALHAAEVDPDGRFRGVRTTLPGDVTADQRARLEEITRAVGRHLAAAGYTGAFGVDAFVFEDADGAVRLHAACEVNARSTFGVLAHALIPRVLGAGEPGALRLGGARELSAAEGCVPLLLPAADDDTAAWIERVPDPV